MGGRFHFSSIIMLRVVTSPSTRHTSKTEATARSSTKPRVVPRRGTSASAPSTQRGEDLYQLLLIGGGRGVVKRKNGAHPSIRHHSHGGVARASGGRQLQIIVADGAAIVTAISE